LIVGCENIRVSEVPNTAAVPVAGASTIAEPNKARKIAISFTQVHETVKENGAVAHTERKVNFLTNAYDGTKFYMKPDGTAVPDYAFHYTKNMGFVDA